LKHSQSEVSKQTLYSIFLGQDYAAIDSGEILKLIETKLGIHTLRKKKILKDFEALIRALQWLMRQYCKDGTIALQKAFKAVRTQVGVTR